MNKNYKINLCSVILIMAALLIICKNSDSDNKPIEEYVKCSDLNEMGKRLNSSNFKTDLENKNVEEINYAKKSIKLIQNQLNVLFSSIYNRNQLNKKSLKRVITSIDSIRFILMISKSGEIVDQKLICSNFPLSLTVEIRNAIFNLKFDKLPKNTNKESIIYQIDVFPTDYGLRSYLF
ncbi:hypothetical protein EHQ68_07790 [Leptospira congkakensis]|uniref:Uncharacterized protein n=1 Tax=Leptospira congkakensis TaxID=2484932 RepID=A0A4Z1AC16_9LEPT|nr:hypothetical protein [Leptospira congkakensis]TGL89517.1 hypothetical protein EHQ68_07790 [Leptospira congkakensis]TGL95142.1 hypothetical protein EHQ69_03360 [Leptospira congkakensis]TGL97872.1 hypothetical protein EHQ70_05775 [Leptospira congkakensis]